MYYYSLPTIAKMKLLPSGLVGLSLGLLLVATAPPPAVAFAASKGGISMPPLTSIPDHLPLAQKCCTYLDSSPDPYHVVDTTAKELERAGFHELDEGSPYQDKVVPGGKYYFTTNRSTIVAFAVGEKYKPGNGFKIIGEYTIMLWLMVGRS